MAGFRRHTHEIYRRRGKRFDPPLTGGPVAFEWSPSTVVQAEKRRQYRVPRGRILQLPLVSGIAPQVISRKRMRHIALRRERFQDIGWLSVITPPMTVWTPIVSKPKLLRYVFQKRGKRNEPPWVGGPPAFVWAPTFISERRVRIYVTRRRKLNEIVPAPTVAASVWTPQNLRARTKPVFVRRTRQMIPGQQQTSLTNLIVRRTRLFGLKRPRRADPYMPQAVVPTPPTFNPTILSRRQRQGFAKRGKRFDRPWVGAAINAFMWYPQTVTHRLRSASQLTRRGKRFDVITILAAPITVWPPIVISRRRPTGLLRRGKRVLAPMPSVQVPTNFRRRTNFSTAKRGQRFDTAALIKVVVPVSPSTLKMTRARAKFSYTRRSKQSIVVPLQLSPISTITSRRPKPIKARRAVALRIPLIGISIAIPVPGFVTNLLSAIVDQGRLGSAGEDTPELASGSLSAGRLTSASEDTPELESGSEGVSRLLSGAISYPLTTLRRRFRPKN